MTLVATPIFISGPDDKLATVDVYTAVDKPASSAQTQLKPEDVGAVKGGNSLSKSDKVLAVATSKSADTGLEMDSDSVVKDIIAKDSGLLSALKSLPSAMQAELTKVSGFNQISGTFGLVKSETKKANLSTIKGLGKLINGIAGATTGIDFKNKSGLSKVAINVVIEATRVGLKGAVKPFLDNIQDKNVLRSIVSGVASRAINEGMTDLLKDTATSTAGRVFIKSVGSLSLKAIEKYSTVTRPNLSSSRTKYSSTAIALDVINIAWREYKRGLVPVVDASKVEKATPEFKRDMKNYVTWAASNVQIPSNLTAINTAINTSTEAYMTTALAVAEPIQASFKKNFPYAMTA